MNPINGTFCSNFSTIGSKADFEINWITIVVCFIIMVMITTLTIYISKKTRNNGDNDETTY